MTLLIIIIIIIIIKSYYGAPQPALRSASQKLRLKYIKMKKSVVIISANNAII